MYSSRRGADPGRFEPDPDPYPDPTSGKKSDQDSEPDPYKTTRILLIVCYNHR